MSEKKVRKSLPTYLVFSPHYLKMLTSLSTFISNNSAVPNPKKKHCLKPCPFLCYKIYVCVCVCVCVFLCAYVCACVIGSYDGSAHKKKHKSLYLTKCLQNSSLYTGDVTVYCQGKNMFFILLQKLIDICYSCIGWSIILNKPNIHVKVKVRNC